MVWQLMKENSEFNPVLLCLKIDLVSHPACRQKQVKYIPLVLGEEMDSCLSWGHEVKCKQPHIVYQERKVTTKWLVCKSINSFIWNIVMVVCMGERERTAMIDTRLRQTYSGLCFFHRKFGTWLDLDLGGHLAPLRADLSTRWQLYWLSGIEKHPHYIFSGRPHSFPSSSIHMIPFHCPLFTLRYSWLLYWLSGIEKHLHYIFSGRPHSFPSCSIHMIHFHCPLFTLRYSWLLYWLSRIEKHLHYIFSGRPHNFPSCSIHMIPFHCPLFTLRYSCNILFRNPQKSISNTHSGFGFLIPFSTMVIITFGLLPFIWIFLKDKLHPFIKFIPTIIIKMNSHLRLYYYA